VRACTSLDAARVLFNAASDRAKAVAASHSAEEWAAPLPPGPIMGGLPAIPSSARSPITPHITAARSASTPPARPGATDAYMDM